MVDARLVEQREEISELRLPVHREVKLTEVDEDQSKLISDHVLTKHDMFTAHSFRVTTKQIHESFVHFGN